MTTEQMDETDRSYDAEREHGQWDKDQQRYADGCKADAPAHEKELPRVPDITQRLKDIGALREGTVDEGDVWVNAPLSTVLEEVARARADEPQYFDGEDKPVSENWTGQATEDPESRVLRAYGNGYVEGLRRGSYGGFDHS